MRAPRAFAGHDNVSEHFRHYVPWATEDTVERWKLKKSIQVSMQVSCGSGMQRWFLRRALKSALALRKILDPEFLALVTLL